MVNKIPLIFAIQMAKKKKRKTRSVNPVFNFLKNYNFEIIAIILFGLGVFLLLEKMEIKAYLYKILVELLVGTLNFLNAIKRAIAIDIETSDLVGIAFIGVAIILIIIRARQRMINRKSVLDICPDCGGTLHRIHRNNFHRVIAKLFLVRIKNYTCKKCSFTGMKIAYLRKH